MKFLNALNFIAERLEEITVSIALGIATVLTFIEVVLRYGFGASMGITQELVIYLLIFSGLVGASIGVRAKNHIGVDLLIKTLPPGAHKLLSVVAMLVSSIFCLIFAYLGYRHAGVLLALKQVTPEMGIPMFVPKSIIPLAFILMSIRFLQEFIKMLRLPAGEFSGEQNTEDFLAE